MDKIDFSNCSEKELWEHLAQLSERIEAYRDAKIDYKNAQFEKQQIKDEFKLCDKYRLYCEKAERRYEKLSAEYEKIIEKEQESEVKMLAVDIDNLRSKYSGLIDVKYWKYIGRMLYDYYCGKLATVKQAIAKYNKK